MPSIQKIQITKDNLVFGDRSGVKTLEFSNIPKTETSIAKVEAWVNNWLAANKGDYQMVCHVFSVSPIKLTVGTFDLGITIPANWWNI